MKTPVMSLWLEMGSSSPGPLHNHPQPILLLAEWKVHQIKNNLCIKSWITKKHNKPFNLQEKIHHPFFSWLNSFSFKKIDVSKIPRIRIAATITTIKSSDFFLVIITVFSFFLHILSGINISKLCVSDAIAKAPKY